jgi:hypothetical protein
VTWELPHTITWPLEPCPPGFLKSPLFFKEIKESKRQNASSMRTFAYLPMARWMPQKSYFFHKSLLMPPISNQGTALPFATSENVRLAMEHDQQAQMTKARQWRPEQQ